MILFFAINLTTYVLASMIMAVQPVSDLGDQYIAIANTYSGLRQDYLAYIYYQRSIAIQPANPKYHIDYAIHANNRSANSVAKYHFYFALLLITNNPIYQNCDEFISKLHAMIAKFVMDTERDMVMSIHHYKMSLKHHDSPRTHYNLARLLHENMDLEKAEIHYLKSLETSSVATDDIKDILNNSIQRRLDYGLLLKQSMKYTEAQQQFEMALKLSKDKNNEILYHYGILLCENLNCYELGLKYLKSATLDVDKEEYRNIYKYYQRKWDKMKLLKQQGINLEINEIPYLSVSDTNLSVGHVENKADWSEGGYDYYDKCIEVDVGIDTEQLLVESVDDDINIKIATCSNEFRRFLKEQVFVDTNVANEYFKQFNEWNLDDIRMLMLYDDTAEDLKDDIPTIGHLINDKLHKKMFMQQVEKYKQNHIHFKKWLNKINLGHLDLVLQNKGILTFESLYYFADNQQDLLNILGNNYKKEVALMFAWTPKCMLYQYLTF